MTNTKSVLWLLATGFILQGCGQNFPMDDELIYSFTTHRQAYQKVVDIFLEKGLYRFEIMSDGLVDVTPEKENSGDFLKIKKLLTEEISVNLVNAWAKKGTYDTISEIAFMNYRRGMVFSGEHKGIVYIVDDSSVKTIVDQLDILNRNDASINGKRIYKKIEPHWYVFYEYFP